MNVGQDLFDFNGPALEASVQRFASGVLAPAIWEGYARANVPMCIAASEVSEVALERAREYARAGGRLMIDSGAYVFRDNPEAMPWPWVVHIYEEICKVATSKVTLILPDVVGCQDGTLEVLRIWGNKVLEVTGGDREVLLPVQRGHRSPGAFVREALLLLAGPIDGLAIPSAAAAFPVEHIKQLADIPAMVPRRVHFLGISRNSKGLQSRQLRLLDIWPGAEVSCDACEHRAKVGKNKSITLARQQALTNLWDDELDGWDETEDTDDAVREALSADFPEADEEDIDAMLCSGMGQIHEVRLHRQHHDRVAGPRATTESIYSYAIEAHPI